MARHSQHVAMRPLWQMPPAAVQSMRQIAVDGPVAAQAAVLSRLWQEVSKGPPGDRCKRQNRCLAWMRPQPCLEKHRFRAPKRRDAWPLAREAAGHREVAVDAKAPGLQLPPACARAGGRQRQWLRGEAPQELLVPRMGQGSPPRQWRQRPSRPEHQQARNRGVKTLCN